MHGAAALAQTVNAVMFTNLKTCQIVLGISMIRVFSRIFGGFLDVWPNIPLHGAAALAQTVDVVMFYEVPPPLAAPHFILSDR